MPNGYVIFETEKELSLFGFSAGQQDCTIQVGFLNPRVCSGHLKENDL